MSTPRHTCWWTDKLWLLVVIALSIGIWWLVLSPLWAAVVWAWGAWGW